MNPAIERAMQIDYDAAEVSSLLLNWLEANRTKDQVAGILSKADQLRGIASELGDDAGYALSIAGFNNYNAKRNFN